MATVYGRSQHETQVESWRQNVQMKLLRLITHQHCLVIESRLYHQMSLQDVLNNPINHSKKISSSHNILSPKLSQTPHMLKKIYYPTINFPNGITIIWFIQRRGLFLWITQDCQVLTKLHFPRSIGTHVGCRITKDAMTWWPKVGICWALPKTPYLLDSKG